MFPKASLMRIKCSVELYATPAPEEHPSAFNASIVTPFLCKSWINVHCEIPKNRNPRDSPEREVREDNVKKCHFSETLKGTRNPENSQCRNEGWWNIPKTYELISVRIEMKKKKEKWEFRITHFWGLVDIHSISILRNFARPRIIAHRNNISERWSFAMHSLARCVRALFFISRFLEFCVSIPSRTSTVSKVI